MDNKGHWLLAVYAESSIIQLLAPLLLLEKTIIFTCNSLSVFAGPFTESVDWFPVDSFLLFFEIFWFRCKLSFDACIFRSRNTLLKRYRFVCYEKVAIRKWRKYHVVQRSISALVVMITNHKSNICYSIQRTNEEYTKEKYRCS